MALWRDTRLRSGVAFEDAVAESLAACPACKRRTLLSALLHPRCDECAAGVVYNGSLVPIQFWRQRVTLFTLFTAERDGGSGAGCAGANNAYRGDLLLDAEGWFSVTPQAVAEHIASRICNQWSVRVRGAPPFAVLDLFAGCGGNTVAFSRHPAVSVVIAFDVDEARLRMAAHNWCTHRARLGGVDRFAPVVFCCGDAVAVLSDLRQCLSASDAAGPLPIVSADAPDYSCIAVGAILRYGVSVRPCAVLIDKMRCAALRLVSDAATDDTGTARLNKQMLPEVVVPGACFMAPPWGGVDYMRAPEAVAPAHAADAEATKPLPPPSKRLCLSKDVPLVACAEIESDARVSYARPDAMSRVPRPAAPLFCLQHGIRIPSASQVDAERECCECRKLPFLHATVAAGVDGLQLVAAACRVFPHSTYVYLPRNLNVFALERQLRSVTMLIGGGGAAFCSASEEFRLSSGLLCGAAAAAGHPMSHGRQQRSFSLERIFLDYRKRPTAFLLAIDSGQ